MPTPYEIRARARMPQMLARLRPNRGAVARRPGTAFDSSDPEGLIRRLDASDCFCRDTRVGRMYHPRDISFRELAPRDSLHVTLRDGRTVSTHVDRHSPLARRQTGGDCRYSPLRIAAHNLTGAARDLVRLARRAERHPQEEHTLVDDHAVSEALRVKEDVADRSGRTGAVRDDPMAPAAPRRGPR